MVYKHSSAQLTVYKDGEHVITDERNSDEFTSGPGDVIIGFMYKSDTKQYAAVTVDEVLIWDEQLDQNDITMLYNSYNSN